MTRMGRGNIAYALTPHGNGTLFERELIYRMSNWLLSLLDRLYIRRRIRAESSEALRRLKHNLESSGIDERRR